MGRASTTSDSFRGGLLLFVAMGVVGPLLWLLFRWASRRAMRRIWLVSLPIWLAYVHGASGLGAAIDERSGLAVVVRVAM